jgi:hypothetical protein
MSGRFQVNSLHPKTHLDLYNNIFFPKRILDIVENPSEMENALFKIVEEGLNTLILRRSRIIHVKKTIENWKKIQKPIDKTILNNQLKSLNRKSSSLHGSPKLLSHHSKDL